jgi:hypothetical protein
MGIRAKKILGVGKLDLLSDMGYYDGQEVAACLEEGITPWISRPNTSTNRKKGLFTKDDFHYIRCSDCYICPAGKRLTFGFQGLNWGATSAITPRPHAAVAGDGRNARRGKPAAAGSPG